MLQVACPYPSQGAREVLVAAEAGGSAAACREQQYHLCQPPLRTPNQWQRQEHKGWRRIGQSNGAVSLCCGAQRGWQEGKRSFRCFPIKSCPQNGALLFKGPVDFHTKVNEWNLGIFHITVLITKCQRLVSWVAWTSLTVCTLIKPTAIPGSWEPKRNNTNKPLS